MAFGDSTTFFSYKAKTYLSSLPGTVFHAVNVDALPQITEAAKPTEKVGVGEVSIPPEITDAVQKNPNGKTTR